MPTPVTAAPTIDPRIIQHYHFVAVSSTGVRTLAEPGAGSHHTYAEAQAKAATLATQTGASYVEIWPGAPPCHNPSGAL